MTRLSFAVSDEVETKEEIECALNEMDTANELGDTPEEFNLARESWLLCSIAMPAVAVQFSVLFIFPQTASTVGRQLGTEELAGFSLASLTGNLTILSVMVGALTAADTLMPRAFGMHQYEQVGQLALRALVMCTLLLIPPIIPLVTSMDWVFDKLGQDPVASDLASQWIRIYLLGVPAMLLFRLLQSFLNAQHVVMPLVVASLTACFIIHPLLLKIMVPVFGFLGSGLAVACTQIVMALLVLVYITIRPEYKPETKPVFTKDSFQKALKPKPLLEFLKLALGGVLALSEWWFWETTCFIVGSFGIVPLCVHTIAYNLVPLLYMIPLGICIGLTVRMGTVLAFDVSKAKQLAAWSMLFTTLLGALVASALYVLRETIVLLFSNDPEVLEGCIHIWPKLCVFIFVLYIFGINTAILRALGMQWHMAAIIFVTCWCGALPSIVYFGIYKEGGVHVIWTILPICYGVMQVLLVLCYFNVNWKEIGNSIRQEHSKRKSSFLKMESPKQTLNGHKVNEETPLL